MTKLDKHRVAWVAGGLLTVVCQPALLACPVCFQVDPGPVADGVRAAVIVLVGVTSSVLTGFAVFVARFARRSKRGATP